MEIALDDCPEKVLDRFTRDTANHAMTVLRIDGLYRHVRFANPRSSVYWFELVTWPGSLCITGDVGSYVFRRVEDMFNFFRDDRKGSRINPGYWKQKLQAADKDGYEKFCPHVFRAAVKDDFDCHFQDSDDAALKAETWKEIEYEIFSALEEGGEHAACTAIHEFDFKGFAFEDFFEHRIVDYTWTYLWCLHAIVWGIERFDAQGGAR